MDIYWIQDKKKCGPSTVPDVISRIELGELTPDTRGWHAGCQGWMPLRELPALADFLHREQTDTAADDSHSDTIMLTDEEREHSPAASAPDSETTPCPDTAAEAVMNEKEDKATEELPTYALAAPSARLLARMIDVAAYLALVYGAVYVRQIPFNPALLPSNPLFWLPFIVLEGALIAFVGVTPGKWLLGIRLGRIGTAGPTLGFLQCLNRAFMVFVCGMGMMFSFLPFITCGISWWMLRRRGITPWDMRCGTLPIRLTPLTPLGVLVVLAVLLGCFLLITHCLQPWEQAMWEEIARQSPEMGDWVNQFRK